MKYVRTKDGLYLNGGKFGKPYAGMVGKKQEIDFGYCFDKKCIIGQADTIEELCDCFVDYCEEDDSHFVSTEIQGIHEIYGAIWTDKGLIYVAKMNEKGEFELL